ncbi:hypothetical protein AgCh_007417 [Apium graveolens]
MKLLGEISGHQVVFMIDLGAPHNFVSVEVVKKIGLPLVHSKGFDVSLGTCDDVQGQGECKSVVLYLQGVTIIEEYFPLQLGNSDVIPGVQWLKKFGTVSTNWKTQTLKLRLGEDNIALEGDTLLGRSMTSSKAMVKMFRKGENGF